MSKHTTTINEIIQSELLNSGHNEFINNSRLSFDNKDFQVIQKIMRYDDDVQDIVNNIIFKGFQFNDDRIDRYFKETFVLRFLDREISRQTVEAFATQVLYVTFAHEDYIYTVFSSDMDKYLQNHVITESVETSNALENETQQAQSKERQQTTSHNEHEDESNQTGTNTSSDRSMTSTLPQSEVNLDVDNDQLTYADENTISKNKTNTSDDSKSRGSQDNEGDNLTNGENDSKRNNQQEAFTNNNGLTKTFMIDNLEKIYDMRERIYMDYDKKCFLQIW